MPKNGSRVLLNVEKVNNETRNSFEARPNVLSCEVNFYSIYHVIHLLRLEVKQNATVSRLIYTSNF